MKKTKIAYAFIAVALVAILSIASAGATLDISVQAIKPTIDPGEPQVLHVRTNEPGVGLLIVLQPAMGDAWTGYLADHPLLAALVASLPPDTLAELYGLIGNKIVSYKLIGPIPEEPFLTLPAIAMNITFPDDFDGINGEPSTALPGDYKVIFVYISNYEAVDQMPDDVNFTAVAQIDVPSMEIPIPSNVRLIELDFACGRWFVIPEFALGTIAPIISSIAALPLAKRYYKRKHA